MSDKYINPSGLAHYDEKIKEYIDTKAPSIGDGTVTGAIESLDSNKLDKTGDSKDNTTSFTSSDSSTVSEWTDVSTLTTGEKHTSIFSKMSQMFKNIRYLYKMLGTTDISAIGDGTATGAISSLNSNLETNAKFTCKHYDLGWKETIGWYRIAEIVCCYHSNSILMEFNFMTEWGYSSSSSLKFEVGWFNKSKVILENTKNILSLDNGYSYGGIRVYKENDISDRIYIDLRMMDKNAIMFAFNQISTDINNAYVRILNSGSYMDDELDTSVYTVLKQIDINKTSDTYTSTLSRISTLESKVSALESSTS